MLQKINKHNDMNFSWIDKSLTNKINYMNIKNNNKKKAVSPFKRIFQAIKVKLENDNLQEKTFNNKNIIKFKLRNE